MMISEELLLDDTPHSDVILATVEHTHISAQSRSPISRSSELEHS